MKCPKCGYEEPRNHTTITIDGITTRRFWCPECCERWETTEKQETDYASEILNINRRLYIPPEREKNDAS